MNRNDLTYQFLGEAFFDEVEKLADEDGYSWQQVGEFFGYTGERSMENVVKGHHKLAFERVLLALKTLSKRDNFRLHRFVLDVNKDVIAPRVSAGNESLKEMHHDLVRTMWVAEKAIEAGSIEQTYKYKRFLLQLAAKVDEELQLMSVKYNEEPVGELEKRLKSAPGMVGTRSRLEKRNDIKRYHCILQDSTDEEDKKVEVTQ